MSGVRADETHRFARTDRIAAAPRHPVDLSDPIEADNAFRIAMAWRELRRCATTPALRYQFFGSSHDALEQGQMDTLDLLLIREGWRMCELAEALRVDPSTATRAVQRLVNDGLAERRQSTRRRARRARVSERRGQAQACGRLPPPCRRGVPDPERLRRRRAGAARRAPRPLRRRVRRARRRTGGRAGDASTATEAGEIGDVEPDQWSGAPEPAEAVR